MNETDNKEERDNSNIRNQTPAGNERRLTITANRIDSRDLFVGTREVVIAHGNDAYHLRLTAQNKLILTK
jgi:hemin uptake protein HemP